MKKLKYLILLFLFIPGLVYAKDDKINKIDIDITLNNDGSAHIVEVWDVKANMGTEFYKAAYNLGNMEISNFKVEENGRVFTFINNWDIDASIKEKTYKNGFYYSSNGLELCWGKGSMGNHTFTISYDISNFIFNTTDAQVLYYNIINEMEQTPKSFSAVIKGPTLFSDTLDVWGYGYKGYAYVLDGKIMMSNEEKTNLSKGDYAVLLVKFPVGTFVNDSSDTYSYYKTFDDVLDKAEAGTYDYDYDESNIFEDIISIIAVFFPFIVIILTSLFVAKTKQKYKFGPAGKYIDMKNINNYRDIPCNKDIFKGYFISQAYNLNNKNTDFLGSLFLKWLFEKKIELQKQEVKKFIGSKEEQVILLKDGLTFENEVEGAMYQILLIASRDNVLESKELSNWSKNHYSELFKWFDKAEEKGRETYVAENLVYRDKLKFMVTDKVKEEAIKVAGLKKFLLEFSRIKEKEAIEVMLWKEYLMFAQIFGIADKVAEQFKELYPEILQESEFSNFDYTDIIMLNHISNMTVVSAASARSAAQSYSGGGGGFSSGGGGGGSFGGGGGGGR